MEPVGNLLLEFVALQRRLARKFVMQASVVDRCGGELSFDIILWPFIAADDGRRNDAILLHHALLTAVIIVGQDLQMLVRDMLVLSCFHYID